ncbi:hypothetical protein AVEN_138188-1 [Araneus ventricosus]|uniref:Uncharacterized protein n=1 Tax=Araneus ventricosus TaxID=182803 RepID=A0A4Y2DFP8_ARAVE|nr:hypothetical protein AVEN_138188-1 [Araneus ventricosus]
MERNLSMSQRPLRGAVRRRLGPEVIYSHLLSFYLRHECDAYIPSPSPQENAIDEQHLPLILPYMLSYTSERETPEIFRPGKYTCAINVAETNQILFVSRSGNCNSQLVRNDRLSSVSRYIVVIEFEKLSILN